MMGKKKPHSAHWLSFNSRQLIIETNTMDPNGASAMNYGFAWPTLCKKINIFTVYTTATRERISEKTNPLRPFWEQLLRAPFAAAGQKERLVHYRQSGGKSKRGGVGEKNASARSSTVSWALMARLPEHHPGELGCRPLSQRGTKINEGSLRQLNKAAEEPGNKWVL